MSERWPPRSRASLALVTMAVTGAALIACAPDGATSTLMPTPIGCGSGFGPPTSDTGTSKERPIWSLSWEDAPTDPNAGRVEAADGSRWLADKAPITVAAGGGGTIRVSSRESARIVVATADGWESGSSENEILSTMTEQVEFPGCDVADTYPAILLVSEPSCLRIEVAPSDRPAYEVDVPIGVSTCE